MLGELNRFFHYKTNSEALTVHMLFCCKALRKQLEHLRSEEKHFFRALAASCVLHNRTEHSPGFSIC